MPSIAHRRVVHDHAWAAATTGAGLLTRTSALWVGLAAGVVGGLLIVTLLVQLAGRSSPSPTVPSAVVATRTPDEATGVASPGPTGAHTPAPTGTPALAATLVAAGDIASCTTSGDEATAKLLDDIAGAVATLGDSVYPDGTEGQFHDCYDPTWTAPRPNTTGAGQP